MYTELTKQAEEVTREIVEKAGLTKGEFRSRLFIK